MNPKVSIIMGSTSDLKIMEAAAEFLDQMEIPYEINALSAHRVPEQVMDFAKNARSRGIKVIIAGAGGAAHLPGVIAALTPLPVIGIPIKSSNSIDGWDSILSILQMPSGIPVATMALDGAKNGAILAVEILAAGDDALMEKMVKFKAELAQKIDKANKKFLSFALGVSAGVMIYVSFVEILHGAQIGLDELLGPRAGKAVCALAFFGGMLLSAVIDKLVPSYENPHEMKSLESMNREGKNRSKLMRTGILTALVVGIHNFPEGIATFMASMNSPEIGIAIAVAIAIHNIPEGIAVSVPVYFATQSRKKAFWYSFLSGLAEPVGALAGYLVLMPFMSPLMLNCIFAVVAGIMVFISLDELLPAAEEYGEHHISIYGLLFGMAVMAISLILLA